MTWIEVPLFFKSGSMPSAEPDTGLQLVTDPDT